MKDTSSRQSVNRSDYRLVLLGAGRPWRGHLPSAVQHVSVGGRVLDWLLDAFKDIPAQFVGGYAFSEIAERYPNLNTHINANWQNTGSIISLLLAVDDNRPTIVSYTDIVVRPAAADALLEQHGDVVMAIDSAWRDRVMGRTREDTARMEMLHVQNGMVVAPDEHAAEVEFAGIIKLSAKAASLLEKNRAWLEKTYARAHLAKLAEWFLFQKLTIRVVDISGNWAELNTPTDLAQFLLGTKFETLSRLSGILQHSRVCDHVGLTVSQWQENRQAIISQIQQKFSGRKLIVRSSAQGEDGWKESLAGKYTSVADIDAGDAAALEHAIHTVASAYKDENPNHQILVEHFLSPVSMSGVAFTRTLKYRAPYYVINYDDKSTKTDTVTGGGDTPLECYTLLRDQPPPASCKESIKRLLAAIQEIEQVLNHNSLDIEFAITPDDTIYILQVRPLTAIEERWRGSYHDVQERVKHAAQYYDTLRKPSTKAIHGDALIFGMMPDWNPAEIIGTRPTRLAESLYRYLVTDDTWATQRAEYGYHDVRPHPLMWNFIGHPYIDVRASFNSFIPATLDGKLKAKLANIYLQQLKQKPELHDKIEFEIAHTCLALDYDKRAAKLKEHGFTAAETEALRDSLISINNNALSRYKRDMAQSVSLANAHIPAGGAAISLQQAFSLLDECKWKGVLPFAHLARSAFIAMTILRSAVAEKLITENDMNVFLASLHNVTSQLGQDAYKVQQGAMEWDVFVATYGHLRPGSYNIATPSYGDDPEYYLRPLVKNAVNKPAPNATAQPWDKLAAACTKLGFEVGPQELEEFVRISIEGRERAKFNFMRYVNVFLKTIKAYGETLGLTADELTHLDLADLRNLAAGHNVVSAHDYLQGVIEHNQLEYDICLGVELPSLITSVDDIYAFSGGNVLANFIGSRSVTAKIAVLDNDAIKHDELNGKIVLILQADPGWDWIFGHSIAGLITAWGGANSHMAIRAAELDLPAAIGTGVTRWNHYAQADELYLNCAAREIKIVV